jgi:hexosaminidase
MAALSEVLWSPKEKKNWYDFERRLAGQFKRYDLWKANYSSEHYRLRATVLPTKDFNGVLWKIQSSYSKNSCEYCYIRTEEEFIYTKDTEIFDTSAYYDIMDPTILTGYKIVKTIKKMGEKGIRFNIPFLDTTTSTVTIRNSAIVRVTQIFHHTRGDSIKQIFYFNKATGKKINLINEASKKYPGDGAFTLVNGIQNEKGMAKTKEFLGFEGTNCEAVIDLGKSENISSVIIHSLNETNSWIWRPLSMEVFISDDGINFTSIGMVDDFEKTKNTNGTMSKTFTGISSRYIKIKIENWGTIPEGSPGAGNKAWLFVDEIEVN